MSSSSSSSESYSASTLDWRPLEDLMNISDPSKLCISCNTADKPRLAKDMNYATSVLKAWKEDVVSSQTTTTPTTTTTEQKKNMGTKVVYLEPMGGTHLHGFLVSPSSLLPTIMERQQEKGRKNESQKTTTIPAILLFHTGAGPQDVFLRWKADILARDLNCVVFIADIISDATGYAWSSNRDQYNAARSRVLAASPEEKGEVARWELRRTITAAITLLKDDLHTDPMAALGWCMGGHPIFELGLMQKKDQSSSDSSNSIKTMISYHGVFDGINDDYTKEEIQSLAGDNDSEGNQNQDTTQDSNDSHSTRTRKVLICNGTNDPFVSENDVKRAKYVLETRGGCDVKILNFEEVKHGFTNPAQDYNPSDAFAFNENAANTSWEATMELLKETIGG